MRRRKGFAVAISLAALLLLVPGSFPGGGAAEEARTAGWEEGTPGRWNSLPQRKAQADKDFFRAEVALAPGTGVLWEKKINRILRPGDTLSIEMVSTGTNRTSRDYRRYDAHFPISVTVVFGQDFESLTWKKRVVDFFRAVWNGFSPGGIRLTFAYGSVVPVGSMYRLGEEETVFILAGEEEQGKRIDIVRDLRDDFRAAYGRDHKGPVTRILVSAERPSRESGP
ncbi:MAG: hypothetical protein ACXW4G_11185, partial [Candidatus Deferrimicrobiaceae bacterium]